MPELAEVDLYRHLLTPFLNQTVSLTFLPPSGAPYTINIPAKQKTQLTNGLKLLDIQRKGKVIKLVFTEDVKLLLSFGMTGRISTEDRIPELESLNTSDYPPAHTHVTFKCKVKGKASEASLSDPRKFGKIQWVSLPDEVLKRDFESLADDAANFISDVKLEKHLLPLLTNNSKAIKGLLLDQKHSVSGIGNWLVDEILYQSHIHPDQSYLTAEEIKLLAHSIRHVCNTAVEKTITNTCMPDDWIVNCKWNKKLSHIQGSGETVKRVVCCGRGTIIVAKVQVLKKGRKGEKEEDVVVGDDEDDGGDGGKKSKKSIKKKNAVEKEETNGERKTTVKKRQKTK